MKIQPSHISLALLALMLGACSHPAFRSNSTRDQIDAELRQARDQKTVDAATEKALLPPLTVVNPVSETKEARFDLSVVNAPAQQVFMAIVSGTRYNMLIGPEVSGHITINLKDVTVREALDSIRELYGYEYRIQGNRISIQPNTLQTRVFQVNYLAAIRAGETELRVTSSTVGSSNPQTNSPNMAYPTSNTQQQSGSTPNTQQPMAITTRVRTTSKNDFWDSLTSSLQTIVGTEGGRNVVVTPNAGVVLVKAFPSELRAVENYLKAIQAIADRQVMLEAKIIEVTLDDSFQAGVNWATFNGSGSSRSTIGNLQPGSTLAPSGAADPTLSNSLVSATPGVAGSIASATASAKNLGFFGLALQTSNFAALINFLETQGSVSVLSSPRVSTLNNQKAVLKVGTDELYVTNVTTNTTTNITGNSTFAPTVTLQPYFSGIALDVTPQIDEDDNIVLHIHPAVSRVAEQEKLIDLGSLGQFKLPLAASTVNESDTVVRARDGLIVAIGGLMSRTSITDRSGLPGTTDSDVGGLFGQRARATQKRELVILLKPTLIRTGQTSAQELDAIAERLDKMGR